MVEQETRKAFRAIPNKALQMAAHRMKGMRPGLEIDHVADQIPTSTLETSLVEMLGERGVVGIGPGPRLKSFQRLEVRPRNRPLQDDLLPEFIEGDESLGQGVALQLTPQVKRVRDEIVLAVRRCARREVDDVFVGVIVHRAASSA